MRLVIPPLIDSAPSLLVWCNESVLPHGKLLIPAVDPWWRSFIATKSTAFHAVKQAPLHQTKNDVAESTNGGML
eukprot:Pgem_evm1s11519